MLTFLKNLLFDESAFIRMARGAGVALGALMANGQLDQIVGTHPTLGAVLMGVSCLVSGTPTTAQPK